MMAVISSRLRRQGRPHNTFQGRCTESVAITPQAYRIAVVQVQSVEGLWGENCRPESQLVRYFAFFQRPQ